MKTFGTQDGKVSHILGGINSGPKGRLIKSACGNEFPEKKIDISSTARLCTPCSRKVKSQADTTAEVDEPVQVDMTDEVGVDSDTEPEGEIPGQYETRVDEDEED